MSWKDDKNLGPWSFEKQSNKPFYNEGNRIASYKSPVFTIDFTGVPITDTHVPCGYWASVPGKLIGNKWDYSLLEEYLGGDYLKGNVSMDWLCLDEFRISWNYSTSAATIELNDEVLIAITNPALSTAAAPYTWEVAGTGFSLGSNITSGFDNILISNGSACGPATITVTDTCEFTCTGYVRCTEGVWSHLLGGCVLSGVTGTVTHTDPPSFTFYVEAIEGKYKQNERWEYNGYLGFCDEYPCCDYCNETTCLTFSGYCISDFPNPCGLPKVGCLEDSAGFGDGMDGVQYYRAAIIHQVWKCP